MKKSKPSFLSEAVCIGVVLAALTAPLWAVVAEGGPYTLTKEAWGVSGGTLMSGGNMNMMVSGGEPLSGVTSTDGSAEVHSGYLAGFVGIAGPLRLIGYRIGTTPYYEDGLRVGVPLDAPLILIFSGPLLPASLGEGIQATILLDHLGRPGGQRVSVMPTYDASGSTVTLQPAQGWQGNTLYDIAITPQLQDLDGFTFSDAVHVQFVTVLDPQQENVVVRPIPANLVAVTPLFPAPSPVQAELSMSIPAQALSEFSLIRVNADPVGAPMRVDPQVIKEANQKALAASGGYSAPLALREINGFNLRGQRLNTLSRPATLSVSINTVAAPRRGALSLWALDENHRLWVKLPSRASSGSQTAAATVGKFSVFAVMSGATGSAVSSYVFPTPWRPHGPQAGNQPGQTGTDQAGMTFNNLPSECTIRIYSLSGDRVRDLRHSDLSGTPGQENWDGKTSHGEPAASGVYLWRVESADENQSGKLMIIR